MSSDVLDTLIHHQLPLAARGDHAAYGRIVAGCQSTVSSIALAIVRDLPASEDIAQEAFLSAWQNLRKLNNPASFLPWLRQITRNLARDHLRAQYHRANPAGDVEALIAAVADPDPSPADSLANEQEEAIAAGVIDALPEESREVLLLYYREGQSSKQVAALLGMQDAAVRKRLSRARQAIREELLVRLGDFAKRSAPGSAFTALVLTSLATASPPAAAASVLSAGAAIGGKSLLKVLAGSMGGIALGLLGAFAGIFYGLKRIQRGALDEDERSQLRLSAIINAIATATFMLGMVLCAAYTTRWLAPTAVWIGFMATIMYQSAYRQPRIMARRHAVEAQRDPIKAARDRRRERWQCWLGIIVGLGMGCFGMAYGLISSGRVGWH